MKGNERSARGWADMRKGVKKIFKKRGAGSGEGDGRGGAEGRGGERPNTPGGKQREGEEVKLCHVIKSRKERWRSGGVEPQKTREAGSNQGEQKKSLLGECNRGGGERQGRRRGGGAASEKRKKEKEKR